MRRSMPWIVLLLLLGAGLVWMLSRPGVGSGDGFPLESGADGTASEVGVGGPEAPPGGARTGAGSDPLEPSSRGTEQPITDPVSEGPTSRVDAALEAWRRGEWSTAIELFRRDQEALPVGFTKQSVAFVYLRAEMEHGDAGQALQALGHQLALLAEHSSFEPLGTTRTIPKTSTLFYRDLEPFRAAPVDPSNAGLPAHHPYDRAGSASVLRRWHDAEETLGLQAPAWNQGAVAARLMKQVETAAARAVGGESVPSSAVAAIARFVALQLPLLTSRDKGRHATFRREAKRFVRDFSGSTDPDIRILADHLRHLLATKG